MTFSGHSLPESRKDPGELVGGHSREPPPPPREAGVRGQLQHLHKGGGCFCLWGRGERRAEGLFLACFLSGWVLPAASCGVSSVPGSVPEQRHVLSAPLSSRCEEGPTVHSGLQMRKPRLRSQATQVLQVVHGGPEGGVSAQATLRARRTEPVWTQQGGTFLKTNAKGAERASVVPEV